MKHQKQISVHISVCKFFVKAVFFVVLLPASVFAQNQNSQAADDVLGSGNYIHIVENLDRSLAFYEALLGAEPNGGTEPRTFGALEPVSQMYNAPDAEFRGGNHSCAEY